MTGYTAKVIISAFAAAMLFLTGCGSREAWTDGYARPIVIDAGHGLPDTGATGSAGSIEADINLSIAKKLMICLKDKGCDVIMTREDENALAGSKNEDMRKRRELIEQAGLAVSIHQNSFPADKNVSGAQVFYAEGSTEGGRLAAAIQKNLNEQLMIKEPRQEHTGDYYIVKSGSAPSVIVECGFISNADEESMLCRSQYQVQIARAVADGIEEYLSLKEENYNDGQTEA